MMMWPDPDLAKLYELGRIRPKSLYFLRYEHLVAGLAGGVMSTLVLHPLDVLKIRWVLSETKYYFPTAKNTRNFFHQLYFVFLIFPYLPISRNLNCWLHSFDFSGGLRGAFLDFMFFFCIHFLLIYKDYFVSFIHQFL